MLGAHVNISRSPGFESCTGAFNKKKK